MDEKIAKIIRSVPVDAVAGRVVSRGLHWEPKGNLASVASECPLPMRVPTACEIYNKGWKDLTGKRNGHLVAIGIYDAEDVGKNAVQVWVMRCDCGRYCVRKAKAIRNPKNSHDRCAHCDKVRVVRRNAHFKEHGFWPAENF